MGGKHNRSKSSPSHVRTRPPGPSRGKVLDMLRQAVGFHAGGQLAMADHLYRQVIELDPMHADALHWLGVLEGQNGNLAGAVALLQRSVASNPDDPVAYNDLGTAQRGLNCREQALESYARALALKPDYAKVYSDRGAVLHELLRLDEARASLEQALALAPGDVEALLRSCRVLAESGQLAMALEQSVRALGLEDSARTQGMFAEVLKAMRFQGAAAGLQAPVVQAIEVPWGRPNELGPAVVSYLKQNPALQACIGRVASLPPDSSAEQFLQALLADVDRVCSDLVLLALLRNVLVSDAELELFLTAARHAMLVASGEGGSPSPALLEFLCALAQQCFINEYVFAISDSEAALAAALRQRVLAMAATGAAPDAASVALVACYAPLASIDGAATLLQHPWPDALRRVLLQQLQEPAEERRGEAMIAALTPVGDGVSQQVRRQYEESPYPRWVKYPLNAQPVTVDSYLGGRFPLAAFERLDKTNADTRLLIAGCGTGQHSIEAALLFRGARVLAVDLSRASLAYALRKTQELKIQGIEYAQADILCMAGIDRQFDVIESMGVLHHLEDPEQGWKVLLGLLQPGGFMRIGLYSERARQPVVAIRQYIATRGFAPTLQGIRECRQALRAETGLGDIGSVLDSVDFYSSSAVRDLLFHVQEHRFGLPALKRLLASLGLNFIGFELETSVLQRYAQYHPHDRAMNDLDAWEAYEADNPLTFSGMYQFWVQKPRQTEAGVHSPQGAAE